MSMKPKMKDFPSNIEIYLVSNSMAEFISIHTSFVSLDKIPWSVTYICIFLLSGRISSNSSLCEEAQL